MWTPTEVRRDIRDGESHLVAFLDYCPLRWRVWLRLQGERVWRCGKARHVEVSGWKVGRWEFFRDEPRSGICKEL